MSDHVLVLRKYKNLGGKMQDVYNIFSNSSEQNCVWVCGGGMQRETKEKRQVRKGETGGR